MFHRALLPDIIKFAYIPHNDIRIHAETLGREHKRSNSPDFALRSRPLATPASSQLPGHEEEEHVLVLEFAENFRGPKKPG
jgi:DEAD/DEAH box helicase domain-containing protein